MYWTVKPDCLAKLKRSRLFVVREYRDSCLCVVGSDNQLKTRRITNNLIHIE